VLAFCLPVIAQVSPVIGFSLAYLRDRWYKDVEYVSKYANELGVKLLMEDANGDVDTQKTQILSLIEKGVQVMIIVPVDAEALSESVEACKKANIKVIAYDRLIKNCDINYYISFNAEKVGELQADYITKIKPNGNYVLLAGPVKDNNAVVFLKGQKKALEPFIANGSINVVFEKSLSEWNHMEAFLEVSALVESGMAIDAVIASNDDLGAGAIMAFENNEKYNNMLITGQDATLEAFQFLLNGKQTMTIYKSIEHLASTTVKQSYNLATGKNVEGITGKVSNGFEEVAAILLEPVVVDKTNIKETVIKDGYYTASEVFGE
jgi:D-xylose transport system substrate-binding protein